MDPGFPNVWARGGLFAFSGLDGATDYFRPFVGSLLDDEVGLYLHTRPAWSLRWDIAVESLDTRRSIISNDTLVIFGPDGAQPLLELTFLDADTLIGRGKLPRLVEEEAVRSFVSATPGHLGLAADGDRFAVAFAENPEASARRARSGLMRSLDDCLQRRRRFYNELRLPGFADPDRRVAYLKAASVLKGNVYSPQADMPWHWTTPDRWPHRHMWLWDSAFHALGLRHLSPDLAQEAVAAVLSRQRVDGFIPHIMDPTPKRLSSVTQPPVLAWAAWKAFSLTHDRDFLAYAYPRLAAYVGWDFENRDRDGDALFEWVKDEESELCHCGESGMDNSPRFDGSGLQAAVDLNAMLVAECGVLARMAAVLGLGGQSYSWLKVRESLRRSIERHLWNHDQGLYLDRIRSEWVMVPTCASFVPLYAGVPHEDRVEPLVAALADERRFWRPVPVPSVAADHPSYSDDMWRGPTWLNMNYLIVEGLLRYRRRDLAVALAERTVEEVARWYRKEGCIFEYYDAEGIRSPSRLSRKRNTGVGVIRDYGWSAAVYMDLCHLLADVETYEERLGSGCDSRP